MEASLPEYLAPGVFVEETSLGGHAIDGVSTSTAAFLGLSERGPIGAVSTVISSYSDFVRVYGDDSDLILSGQPFTNYMARAVRGFFDNGGNRLFVVRVSPPQPQAKGSDTQKTNVFHGLFHRILWPRFALRKRPTATYRDALRLLENVPSVSIIAAPSAAHAFIDPIEAVAHLRSVQAELIAHAEKMQHCFAVLDPPLDLSPKKVSTFANALDSSYAALYYPWLKEASSGANSVPPSGAICGIYARTDRQHGVWKAPANVTIAGISGFERDIHAAEQEMLNPIGVNVSRAIPGRGLRLYGARTLSSDPEWRYVSIRRYLSFIETSICDGISWAVFEPNDEPLWAEFKSCVEVFLSNNFRQGALQGQTETDAFFVRCDRTTMTQSDIDNGRLIAQVGVAILKPAEFRIIRIKKNLSRAA
ncbi:MAG: phage tail sheath subtilisin-like domain-containing protein [Roseobacter sp.]